MPEMNTQPTPQQKIEPSCLEIKVSGKLIEIEQIQGKEKSFYANKVVIPAVDQFSKPTQLVIYSKLPFADKNAIVQVVAFVTPQWRNNNGKWFFSCSLWKDKLNNA